MKLVEAGSQILFSRLGQVLANAALIMVVAKTLGPTRQGHYSLTVAVAMLLASLLAGGMGLAAVPALRKAAVPARRMLKASSRRELPNARAASCAVNGSSETR